MLFFQTMLLAGYAAAHLAARAGAERLALRLHAGLALAAGGCALASRTLPALSQSRLSPALSIALTLGLQVGAPYLLLSSTAPSLQRWAAACGMRAPQRLYAVSNAGSLLALLGYPALIEGSLPLPMQYRLWAYACAVFALALAGCALITSRMPPAQPVEPAEPQPSAAQGWHWAACAFVPSVFLLAATNHITVDIAPTPLLWVLPLALYLLSFILAFAGSVTSWRGWLLPAFIVASTGLGYNAFAEGSAPLWRQLGFSLGALFIAALLCHDALLRTRPADHALTGFYVWIALGGALGGLFVSLIAPLIWNDYYELELATLLTYALLLWFGRAERAEPGWPVRRRWLQLGLGVCVPLLTAAVLLRATTEGRTGRVLERRRSFLGALRVTQFDVGRVLTHGRIRHGMQLAEPARHDWPTMYFGRGTAVARVLERHASDRARNIGVVGLGVGTLAAYARAGDALQFYELDPNVVEIAQQWFTFLKDSPARTRFQLGDGRLLLAQQPDQHFDVLVLDAFSSDAVPAHLLTREAFDIYVRQLAPDGVLLANVSNRHLAVDRVVRAAARAHGLACEVVETPADAQNFVSKVRWAVMTRDPAALAQLLEAMTPAAKSGDDVLWTDAQTSIWSILR
jgi:predicted O-methyltransferase YrrM